MERRKNPAVYFGLPRDVYAICAFRVINGAGSFVAPLLTLILTQKIGFSAAAAGLFTTILTASQGVFLLLGGRLTDTIGAKKNILLFDAAGAALYFACGFFKPSFLTALLVMAGADAFAAASSAFSTAVAAVAPPGKTQEAFSLCYLATNLGMIVGPLAGGLLFARHMPLLFFLDAATTFAGLAFIFAFVQERRTGGNAESCGDKPVSVWTVFRAHPILPLFAVAALVYFFCYEQWYYLLPLQSARLFRDGAGFYSLLVSVNAVAAIVFTPPLTVLSNGRSPLRAIAGGGALYAAAFALFAVHLPIRALFIAGILVMTLGEALVSIHIGAFIAERTPEACLGRVNSVMNFLMGTGAAVGPAAMGLFLTARGFRASWLLVTGLMAAAVAGAFLLDLLPGPKTALSPENEGTALFK